MDLAYNFSWIRHILVLTSESTEYPIRMYAWIRTLRLRCSPALFSGLGEHSIFIVKRLPLRPSRSDTNSDIVTDFSIQKHFDADEKPSECTVRD